MATNIAQAGADLDAEVNKLLDQGASNEEIDAFIIRGGQPEPELTVDSDIDAHVSKLIDQGVSDEEIDEEVRGLLQRQSQAKEEIALQTEAIEKPKFFDKILDEDQDNAFAAYQLEGKEGVLKYFARKAELDEEYEESLKEVEWLGGLADREDRKNIIDGWDNFKLTIQQAYPNLHLATSRIARSMFGEDNVDDWVEYAGKGSFLANGLSREEQQEALDDIAILKSQHKDTGAIVDGFKNGDIAGALSGVIASPLSLASTMANLAQTFGAGIFTDMFSETYLSVNELRAEKLGISLDELVSSGQDSVASPVAFASVMTALEGSGLAAVGKYMLSAVGATAKKRFANYLVANNIEGVTEALQTGLGKAAEVYETTGGDAAASAEALLDGTFSEEAAEAYATGFFAGGVSGPIIKPAIAAIKKRAMGDRSNQEEIDEVVDKIADLEDILRSDPSLTDETRKGLTESIGILKEEGKVLADQPYKALVNLRTEDISELEQANEQITAGHARAAEIEADPALDDAAKAIELEAIDKQIEANQNYAREVVQNSNNRVAEEDTAVVEGIKTADKLNKEQEAINEKRQDIKDQEAALAADEKPNPSTTKKLNRKKVKLDVQEAEVQAGQKAIPAASNEALASAENVDQAVEQTTQKQEETRAEKEANPVETIARQHDVSEGTPSKPRKRLASRSEITPAKQEVGKQVEAAGLGQNINGNYGTTTRSKANEIARIATRAGLVATVSKEANANYFVAISNPNIEVDTFRSAFDNAPNIRQLDKNSAYVTDVINKIQKFFGNALDVDVRTAAEVGAWGKVVLEDGKVKILISDGSHTKDGIKSDTLFHEPAHILYQLLANSTDPKAKAIFSRIENLIAKEPEYKETKNNPQYANLTEEGIRQEAFAKYLGNYAVSQTLSKKSPLQTWLDKMVKYVKDTFGVDLKLGKMNLKDVADIFISDLSTGTPTLVKFDNQAVLDAFNASNLVSFKANIQKRIDTLKARHNKLVEANAAQGTISETGVALAVARILQKEANDDTRTEVEQAKEKFAIPDYTDDTKKVVDSPIVGSVIASMKKALEAITSNDKHLNKLITRDPAALLSHTMQGILADKSDNYSIDLDNVFDEDGKKKLIVLGGTPQINNRIGNNLEYNIPEGSPAITHTRASGHGGSLGPNVLMDLGIIKRIPLLIDLGEGENVSTVAQGFWVVKDVAKFNALIAATPSLTEGKALHTDLQSSPNVQTGYSQDGKKLMKTYSPEVREALNKRDENGDLIHKELYEQLNKAQAQGHYFNQERLGLYLKLLEEENVGFLYEGKKLTQDERNLRKAALKAGLIKAAKWGPKLFYLNYFFDYRTRFNVMTTLVGPQAAKTILSLYEHKEATPLGANGVKWLWMAFADATGNKNIGNTHSQRVQWTADPKQMETIAKIGADPHGTSETITLDNGEVIDGWLKFDEPYVALQLAQDIHQALLFSQDPKKGTLAEYPSSVPIHLDESQSGASILTLMVKSEDSAQFLNLLANAEKKDLYSEIGNAIWAPKKLLEDVIPADKVVEVASKLQELEKAQVNARHYKANKAAFDAKVAYIVKNEADVQNSYLAFLKSPKVEAKMRSLMKLPVMIQFYSAGPNRMAKSLMKKFKNTDGFENANEEFMLRLATEVRAETKRKLPHITALMDKLAEVGLIRAKNSAAQSKARLQLEKYIKDNREDVTKANDLFFSQTAIHRKLVRLVKEQDDLSRKTNDHRNNPVTFVSKNGTLKADKDIRKAILQKISGITSEQFDYVRWNYGKIKANGPKEITPEDSAFMEGHLGEVRRLSEEASQQVEAIQAQKTYIEKHPKEVKKATHLFFQTPRINRRVRTILTQEAPTNKKGKLDVEGKWKNKYTIHPTEGYVLTTLAVFKTELEALEIGITEHYAEWLYGNPAEFFKLASDKKRWSSAETQLLATQSEVLKDLGDAVKVHRRGSAVEFQGEVNKGPIRLAPYDNVPDSLTIISPSGKSYKMSTVAGTGNLNWKNVQTQTPPNITHAGDAQTPSWLALNTDLPLIYIHDSFGTTAGRTEELFNALGQSKAEIFEGDYLLNMFTQIFKGDTELAQLHVDEALSDKEGKKFKSFDVRDNVTASQNLYGSGNGATTQQEYMSAFDADTVNNPAPRKVDNKTLDPTIQQHTVVEGGVVYTASAAHIQAAKAAGIAVNKKFWKSKGGKGIWGSAAAALVPPAADDYHGLVQVLTKNNKVFADFIKDNVTIKYQEGYSRWVNATDAIENSFKQLTLGVRQAGYKFNAKTGVNILGVDLSVAQVVKAASASDATLLKQDISQAEIDGLRGYIAANPVLNKFSNKLVELGILRPTEGGLYLKNSFAHDLNQFIQKELFQHEMADFLVAKDKYLNKAAINVITAKYGDKFGEALEDSLTRMSNKRGFSQTADIANRLDLWLTGSIGAIMFFNFKSAMLQMLSVVNYATASSNPGLFLFNLVNVPGSYSLAKELFNDPYLKQRRKRVAFDVNANEIFSTLETKGFVAVVQKLLQFGFAATSYADSLAVSVGGAAFIKTELASDKTMEEARFAWKEQTEEAQQSSRPDRVSQWQTDSGAKYILAFANTPAQYFRLVQKATRRFGDSNSTTAQKRKAVADIAVYMFINNLIFAGTQQAMESLFDGDEEEKQAEQQKSAINSLLDTMLRGMGVYGAIFSGLKNLVIELERQEQKKQPDVTKALLKLIDIAPPVSKKLKALQKIGSSWKYDRGEEGLDNPWATTTSEGVTFATNIPADWLHKKARATQELWDDNYGNWQKFLLVAGWPEYILEGYDEKSAKEKRKKSKKKNKKKTRGRSRSRSNSRLRQQQSRNK